MHIILNFSHGFHLFVIPPKMIQKYSSPKLQRFKKTTVVSRQQLIKRSLVYVSWSIYMEVAANRFILLNYKLGLFPYQHM